MKNDLFGKFWAFLVPEMFFIGLLVFSLKRLENPQNRIFSKKTDFFKKSNFEDFQALLEKKLKVLWKKFPGQEMLKIIKKIHFLYLEVGKSKNQNFAFLKKKFKYFSRTPVQALGKNFFF